MDAVRLRRLDKGSFPLSQPAYTAAGSPCSGGRSPARLPQNEWSRSEGTRLPRGACRTASEL